MSALALIFGMLVGLALGLTGGGGAIFAVPLLVYGLAIEPRQAVGISLAAVGATAAFGFFGRWKTGQVEIPTGLLFAVAGMIGAPLGSWLSGLVPESLLLLMFATLMGVVALRMWQGAGKAVDLATCTAGEDSGQACQRDPKGNLHINSPCAILLVGAGVLTGVLSGLFGVGGGFIIVPALVLFSKMSIHRAIGTSLMVIALVSTSGVASHYMSGRTIPWEMTGVFVVGGVAGMLVGSTLARRVAGPALQRGFAGAMVAVAAFVVIRTTLHI